MQETGTLHFVFGGRISADVMYAGARFGVMDYGKDKDGDPELSIMIFDPHPFRNGPGQFGMDPEKLAQAIRSIFPNAFDEDGFHGCWIIQYTLNGDTALELLKITKQLSKAIYNVWSAE